jgi:transcriptional regulator with XRE-family HTH domain
VPRRTAADPIARSFGEAVRRRRQERGETLEEVARRIPRMDPKYLGELERGWHAATLPTAKRIADALEASLSELVEGL